MKSLDGDTGLDLDLETEEPQAEIDVPGWSNTNCLSFGEGRDAGTVVGSWVTHPLVVQVEGNFRAGVSVVEGEERKGEMI
ncbi:hypothetical protein RRG08_038828 [Elysia crispata]|uniref:Uncharacterized protein n=1 Tax=Elysia crispata TaxID=231223 RepID=A0AAE0YT78_9GAST|nr:hypothetical protein RRG08_038828 [Elysia crispata]